MTPSLPRALFVLALVSLVAVGTPPKAHASPIPTTAMSKLQLKKRRRILQRAKALSGRTGHGDLQPAIRL